MNVAEALGGGPEAVSGGWLALAGAVVGYVIAVGLVFVLFFLLPSLAAAVL